MTEDKISGKLEMVFAHLSINNVRDIKPLLFDAIDEYQAIRSNLTYDQKQKVNFIKSLLFHAEREEWNQARQQLNGAQRAYQEYISNKFKAIMPGSKVGYAQIHGRGRDQEGKEQLALPWKESKQRYMFKDDDVFTKGEIERESSTNADRDRTSVICHRGDSTSSSKLSPFKMSVGNNEKQLDDSYRGKGTRTPEEDEQGPSIRPSFLRQNLQHVHEPGYPGTYAKKNFDKPKSLEEALARVRPESRETKREFDPNRPSKIAEAYQDLFDKEWHHALDAIKRMAVIEETAIECLLYIITEAYSVCIEEAKGQILQFEHALLNIITDGKYTTFDRDIFDKTGNVKHILQYRREVSDLAVKRLQDAFLVQTLPVIYRRYGVRKDDAVDVYARQCIYVTWRMAIQDPPITLETVDSENQHEFSTSLYKSYTKTSGVIDYLIWPALRIYRDGPVLCRGVAQCK